MLTRVRNKQHSNVGFIAVDLLTYGIGLPKPSVECTPTSTGQQRRRDVRDGVSLPKVTQTMGLAGDQQTNRPTD